MAGLCKAEGANRVTTSNTKCITVHLLLTGIDGIHYPMKSEVSATQAYLQPMQPPVLETFLVLLGSQRMAGFVQLVSSKGRCSSDFVSTARKIVASFAELKPCF